MNSFYFQDQTSSEQQQQQQTCDAKKDIQKNGQFQSGKVTYQPNQETPEQQTISAKKQTYDQQFLQQQVNNQQTITVQQILDEKYQNASPSQQQTINLNQMNQSQQSINNIPHNQQQNLAQTNVNFQQSQDKYAIVDNNTDETLTIRASDMQNNNMGQNKYSHYTGEQTTITAPSYQIKVNQDIKAFFTLMRRYSPHSNYQRIQDYNPLSKDNVINIGRKDSNQIVLCFKMISREQCIIFFHVDKQAYIKNISRSGTFLLAEESFIIRQKEKLYLVQRGTNSINYQFKFIYSSPNNNSQIVEIHQHNGSKYQLLRTYEFNLFTQKINFCYKDLPNDANSTDTLFELTFQANPNQNGYVFEQKSLQKYEIYRKLSKKSNTIFKPSNKIYFSLDFDQYLEYKGQTN